MPKTEEKKKGLKLPHQLVILFIIAALATLATYIVPAGVYDSIEMDGRKVIDAASFHYIDQTPVGPWTALLALPGGFVKNAGIIALFGMISGLAGGAFCTSSTAVAQELVGLDVFTG